MWNLIEILPGVAAIGLNVAATLLSYRRRRACWLLWAAACMLMLARSIAAGDPSGYLLWTVNLGLNLFGYRSWRPAEPVAIRAESGGQADVHPGGEAARYPDGATRSDGEATVPPAESGTTADAVRPACPAGGRRAPVVRQQRTLGA
jgi:hypothetical protein